MKIFVEQYRYKKELLYELFEPRFIKDVDENHAVLQCVGFYTNNAREIYIVLPKLFEKDGTLFNDIDVEEFAQQDYRNALKGNKEKVAFVHDFTILLFQTLMKYQRENKNEHPDDLSVLSNMEDKKLSIIETIFSVIKFHKQNQHLYIKEKGIDKKKTNKIHWNKTIKKNMPVMYDENVHYFHFKYSNSRLSQNDIVLMVFYSLLNKIKCTYNINISLDSHLPIMPLREFIKFERKIPKILKNIRSLYIRDDMKQLVKLLNAYYQYESISAKKDSVGYIVVFNFNLLFEDMVNEILSDKEHLAVLKVQKDGKIIDHIFSGKSFVTGSKIFFIGDSKYYKGETVHTHSIFKQFTYSRNIIQEFEKNRGYFDKHNILLREDFSRGYDAIPNFFVFGDINHEEYKKIPEIPIVPFNQPLITKQFENVFFDRDTFHIFYFKINLLFLMKAYTIKIQKIKKQYQSLFRKIVRTRIADYYNHVYDMFILQEETLKNFIKSNYYIFWGKVFFIGKDRAVLVLEKNREDSNLVKECVKSNSNILINSIVFK